jgi:hypothetical protein
VRGAAVDGNIGGLVGRRIDAETRAGRPDLGLVDLGNAALEGDLLIVGPGQLQAAQHASLAVLLPRLVTGPQHADRELAVRVELVTEVAFDRGLALLEADLLDARGGRRRGVGAVLGPRVGAHVDGFGDFEPMIVLAVDDGGRVRVLVRPGQAASGLGFGERRGSLGAAGQRV